jgi:tRNA pseudouridine32 synthase/23S rRNA pseudouridine746 synthase
VRDPPVLLHTSRYVVVEKPPNFLSVPGIGPDKADCIAARVRAMLPFASGPLIVHRLDFETSGLMLLALDAETHRRLSAQFARRRVHKEYISLLEGSVESDEGMIDLPIRLDLENRPRQIVDFEQGRPSLTRYRVLAREHRRTRVLFEPLTGRTHQIRVHAAFSGSSTWPSGHRACAQMPPYRRLGLGHSICGDPLYGRGSGSRLMLHASVLEFADPYSGSLVRIESTARF